MPEGSLSGSAEEPILTLQRLLRAEDDGVDVYVTVEEEIWSYDYAHVW